jgi:hypothetical protein
MGITCFGEFFTAALVAGLVIAGGLFGVGARIGIGGLNGQRTQLHQCVLASQHDHPSEDTRSLLAHLRVAVPDCMEAAGYVKALDNDNCALALWQGDVYCYLPKSLVGKLLYKMATLAGRIT